MAFIVLTVACSTSPSATTSGETSANTPATVMLTTSSPPTTSTGPSLGDLPGLGEAGGWGLLPYSSLVVAGQFVARNDPLELNDDTLDHWTFRVSEVLVGEGVASGETIDVLSSIAEDRLGEIMTPYPWPLETDVVVFLRKARIATSHFLVTTDYAVLWNDLPRWKSALASGAGILGAWVGDTRVVGESANQAIRDAMSALAAEFGPIPLEVAFYDAEDAGRRLEILVEIQHQPLTVVTGDIEVIFDQWFFSTFSPEARVTVVGPGGVLTEGPVTGPDAVMREIPDVGFAFYDQNGNEVARISHDQLGAAADEAACAGGVTC